MTTSSLGFRHDIEGLRAVSIISVVLYHARVPGFTGGFVGVDIFFVISGFLIIGKILDELVDTGKLDLWAFWARRARRLLPNAFVTILVTLALAALLLPASMREQLAREAFAALLYFANFQLADKAVDYFRLDDAASPLMHFWSLSIEEQFYLVLPLAMMAIAISVRGDGRRLHATVTLLVVLVWIGSFAANVWLVRSNQPLAFFQTQTRCWQLATGGLAALFIRSSWAQRWAARDLTGWLGLAAVGLSVIWFNESMRYPGELALLPTFAAFLLIVAPSDASARLRPAAVLALPPLRWIGARSYSWYLWHWPTIVFAEVLLPQWEHAALAAVPVSLLIAALLYSLVEDPIRQGRWLRSSPRTSLVASGCCLLVCVVICRAYPSLPVPGGAAQAAIAAEINRSSQDIGRNYSDKCHLDLADVEQPDCKYGAVGAPLRAVLFGDSHAAQWFSALEAAAGTAGWQLQSWTKTSCPVADIAVWYPGWRAAYVQCHEWRRKIVQRLSGADRPDLVFVSSLVGYGGWQEDRATGKVLVGADADAAWESGLRITLGRLLSAGVPVVLIRDTPKAIKSFAACLEAGGDRACDRRRSQAVPALSIDAAVAAEFEPIVRVLDATDRICSGAVCQVARDGRVIYRDHHHVTSSHVATLSDMFLTILTDVATSDTRKADATRSGDHEFAGLRTRLFAKPMLAAVHRSRPP